MPTSRYELYPIKDNPESKEEIVGEGRIYKDIGEVAIKGDLESED